MNKPTIKEAKKICKSAGFCSKIIKKESYRNNVVHVFVKPLGANESFINQLIEMRIFTHNGMIKCQK